MLKVLKIQHIVLFVIVFVLGFGSVNKRGECYCEECGGGIRYSTDKPEIVPGMMAEHCKNHDSICSVSKRSGYAREGDARCIPCDCVRQPYMPSACIGGWSEPSCAASDFDHCINKLCSKNNCSLGQQCVYIKTDSSRKICILPKCIIYSYQEGDDMYDKSICNNKPCSGNCKYGEKCVYETGVPKQICVPKECVNGDTYDPSFCTNKPCSTNTCSSEGCVYSSEDPPRCVPKDCMNGNTYDPSICKNQFCSTNNCSSGQVCVYGEGDPPKQKCVGKDCMVRGYFVASDCSDPTDAILNSPDVVGINKSLCGAYNLMTGKVARAGVGVALITTGGMFFFGKIGLVTLLSIGTGSGIIFGTPSIMKVVIGKKLEC